MEFHSILDNAMESHPSSHPTTTLAPPLSLQPLDPAITGAKPQSSLATNHLQELSAPDVTRSSWFQQASSQLRDRQRVKRMLEEVESVSDTGKAAEGAGGGDDEGGENRLRALPDWEVLGSRKRDSQGTIKRFERLGVTEKKDSDPQSKQGSMSNAQPGVPQLVVPVCKDVGTKDEGGFQVLMPDVEGGPTYNDVETPLPQGQSSKFYSGQDPIPLSRHNLWRHQALQGIKSNNSDIWYDGNSSGVRNTIEQMHVTQEGNDDGIDKNDDVAIEGTRPPSRASISSLAPSETPTEIRRKRGPLPPPHFGLEDGGPLSATEFVHPGIVPSSLFPKLHPRVNPHPVPSLPHMYQLSHQDTLDLNRIKVNGRHPDQQPKECHMRWRERVTDHFDAERFGEWEGAAESDVTSEDGQARDRYDLNEWKSDIIDDLKVPYVFPVIGIARDESIDERLRLTQKDAINLERMRVVGRTRGRELFSMLYHVRPRFGLEDASTSGPSAQCPSPPPSPRTNPPRLRPTQIAYTAASVDPASSPIPQSLCPDAVLRLIPIRTPENCGARAEYLPIHREIYASQVGSLLGPLYKHWSRSSNSNSSHQGLGAPVSIDGGSSNDWPNFVLPVYNVPVHSVSAFNVLNSWLYNKDPHSLLNSFFPPITFVDPRTGFPVIDPPNAALTDSQESQNRVGRRQLQGLWLGREEMAQQISWLNDEWDVINNLRQLWSFWADTKNLRVGTGVGYWSQTRLSAQDRVDPSEEFPDLLDDPSDPTSFAYLTGLVRFIWYVLTRSLEIRDRRDERSNRRKYAKMMFINVMDPDECAELAMQGEFDDFDREGFDFDYENGEKELGGERVESNGQNEEVNADIDAEGETDDGDDHGELKDVQ